MIAALAQTLAQRSPRERRLLAILALVVVPLAFVFLVALPLLDQRANARAALTEAQASRVWYRTRQAEIAALPGGDAPRATATAPVGLGGIEASLIDAGLRGAVSFLANAQGDAVSLTLTDVPFEGVMHWIDGIEADAGYRLSALRLERMAAGLVTAELRLEPPS